MHVLRVPIAIAIDRKNHLIPHVALLSNFELWFSSESPRPSKNHGMLLDLQLSRRLRFEKAASSFLVIVAHSPENFVTKPKFILSPCQISAVCSLIPLIQLT